MRLNVIEVKMMKSYNELLTLKTFEERFECLKLLNVWLKFSDDNFPLIFCQAVAAMSTSDELFKKKVVLIFFVI